MTHGSAPRVDDTVSASLLPHHAALLTASGITPDVVTARGYRSATEPSELAGLGFSAPQQRLVPGLLIPIWSVQGMVESYQLRPDRPRLLSGKVAKYETRAGSRMLVDVPPIARREIGHPAIPLVITEGPRKADSAVSQGVCCVALLGVWTWRGTNGSGGKVALPDWESIAVNGRRVYLAFDSDVTVNPRVQDALQRLGAFLMSRKAHVFVLHLPPGERGEKVGLDDYFAAGHSCKDLFALAADLRQLTSIDTAPCPYRIEGGRICRERHTRDGVVIEPLCNFVATITEELALDDGAETTRAFLLTGSVDRGDSLPAIRVPAARFGTMNWVTEQWGLRPVVFAGTATRDALREGIQRLSPDARRRHVYTHTGWRQIEGQWVYLSAGGALGRDDVEVDLGPELARYSLPSPGADAQQAMTHSLKLVDVASPLVTIPLFAAVYRAPLVSIFPLDFSLWLEGFTGSLKSTLAGLGLAHYGDFDRKHLPGAWTSTANQLERRAFVLKDTVYVIDDYAPSGLDTREMETKAARLLRGQGNLSGRGRLRADLTERPAFPPRGLIIATGEQHAPGQSILARTLLIHVEREQIRFPVLTPLQQHASQLPHAMAGYLTWLTPQLDTLPGRLREQFDELRAQATSAGHLRVPETLAHLYLGLDMGLRYAEEIGACSVAQATDIRESGWDTLLALGRAQAQSVEEERPTRRFLKVVLSLITQGRAVVLDKDAALGGPRPGADLLGWHDAARIYLIPEAAYAAVSRVCRDSGEPFAIREERLRRDLAREGVSDCDPDRFTRTIRLDGGTRRVLALRRAAVEALLEEQWPHA